MPQLHPGWQLSAVTAASLTLLLAVCTLLGRRYSRGWLVTLSGFAREFAVIMSLFGLWQYVGVLVHTRVAGAMDRGRAINAWQLAWHLPSEQGLQRLVLRSPTLTWGADLYYAYAHLNVMTLFVVWLWWRRRQVYPRARIVIILSTLACLLVQLVPVAPPRLLPDLGFVDTALQDGTSVYGEFGTGMANQLAAMPSVHVGWAVLVGWYVWRTAPRAWRWIGPLHAVLTVLVVAATGNHWWLDALVAAGLDALAILGVRAVRRLSRRPRAAARAEQGAELGVGSGQGPGEGPIEAAIPVSPADALVE